MERTEFFSGIAAPRKLRPALLLSAIQVVLIMAAAIPGAFVHGFYHDTAKILATDRGTDLLALVVIAPALAVSIFLSARDSLRAQIVWLGITSWTAYNYAVYAFGLNFTPMFLVYVAILGLAVFTLVIAIRAVDPSRVQDRFLAVPRRITAGYLWLVAGIFSLLWLSDVVPATFGGTIPAALRDLGSTSNPVEVNDLGIILPALVLGGIWIWAKKPAGYVLAGVLLGLATVTMAAVVPGGPIFGGQALDPIYAGVAVLSLALLGTFLVKIRPAEEPPIRLAGRGTLPAHAS